MKKMQLEHGVNVITFEVPPVGFDISKASNDDLKRFGFPYDVTDPAQQQRYDLIRQKLQGRFHYVTPTFQVNADRFHGPRKAADGSTPVASGTAAGTSSGAETSNNWSGGVLHAPAGQSYKWVQGDWVVPNVGAPTQGKWYYSSSWIGLDGDGSGDVCQAGVECEVFQSGSTVTRSIYPWFEWYPLPETKITNLAINPGDMITMTLCTAGPNSTTATVVFANHTTGASTTVNFSAPAGTKLVGNCAEWIVEAPTVGGAQSSIPDYGEVFFSACTATQTSNGATVNGGTGNTISLVSGGKTLATGSIVTPTVILSSYTGTLPPA